MYVNDNVLDGQHLNARTGDSTTYPIKYFIPRGDEVTVVSTNVAGTWKEVYPTNYSNRGKTWVMASYLSSSQTGCKRDTKAFALGDKDLLQLSFGRYTYNLQVGLGITADGDFGYNTDSAVRTFQTNNGLTVDGIVGANTKTALWNDSTIQNNILNNGI